MDQGKPTLETLPIEIQLSILRHFLRCTRGDMVLSPCHQNRTKRQKLSDGNLALPGISGILRTSKQLSNLALGVLYGENVFLVCEDSYDFTDDSDCDGEEWLERKDMKNCPWSNLRNYTNEELKSVSSVECLDLMSQTRPGQTMLRKLVINLGTIVMMRTLTGVLPRILRRLRGLQHIEFRITHDWENYVVKPDPNDYVKFGQGFLRLIKSELGHVKTIIIDDDITFEGDEVTFWMTFELVKRNKAWVPPSSACESFRTTFSPFQYFSMETMERVLSEEHRLGDWTSYNNRGDLEDKFGVF